MKIKLLEIPQKNFKIWKVLILFTLSILIVGGILFFYFNVYKVVPAFSEVTYEYGESVSRDIADYLTGSEWSVKRGELDLSQVDEDRTGTYQAAVRHGGKEFTYTVIIQDTVPPQIYRKEEQIYLAAGAFCTVEDIIGGISDVDDDVEAFFVEDGQERREIKIDQKGQYYLSLLARDSAGNVGRSHISVIVDNPPAFSGIHDFYVIPGSRPDYLASISARDEVDGDVTESIVVDDSEVELAEEGQYSLLYLAEDSYGLQTVEEALVLVASPGEIQDLIGSRRIDYRVDTIMGAPNIYDAGASAHENLEETLEYMRPALVQIFHATGKGGYSAGSGYIMEITDDTIYICSNRHVVTKYEDWDIYFFDGTKVAGKMLGSSDAYDVGVVTVALEDVPEELLNRLMTVHIDKTYWESLDQQPIEVALERVDQTGGLLHITTGNLIETKQDFEWYDKRYHTEVTVKLVHGDSGSAVLDGYGNLIGMAYAYSTSPRRYWCVPLDGILECYEEITGRVPYVY